MERLTKRLSNGNATWNYPIICFGEDDSRSKVFKSVHRQKACEKLAAYEESGLEPEEIMEAVKLFSGTNADVPKEIIGWVERATWHCKRLAELTRLVSFDRLRELAQAEKDGRIVVLPEDGMIYCIEEITDGERWISNKPIQDILILHGWGLASLKCSFAEIGKTVFLTREAAEAALEGREAGHDR